MAETAPLSVPVLTSTRLRLRPYRADDAPAMFALYSDPRVMRYWSFPAWIERAQVDAYLARTAAHAAQGLALPWAVADATTDTLLGTATLFSLELEQGRAEIGYSLSPDRQGRGLATEALRLVLAHAFGNLALRRIEADVDPRNLASCRLLERLGFRREGLLRERWLVAGERCDTALFGLLAEEFDLDGPTTAAPHIGAPRKVGEPLR
jgi:RimJ/RimL family protein N-acetyltransferase